jgi:hypothetical protein
MRISSSSSSFFASRNAQSPFLDTAAVASSFT